LRGADEASVSAQAAQARGFLLRIGILARQGLQLVAGAQVEVQMSHLGGHADARVVPLGLRALNLGVGRFADGAVGADYIKLPRGHQATLQRGGARHAGLRQASRCAGLGAQARQQHGIGLGLCGPRARNARQRLRDGRAGFLRSLYQAKQQWIALPLPPL
jgi:hypothetical protein